MPYTEAIQYLKDHNITKDDGTFYEFGDVCLSIDLKLLKIKILIFALYRIYQKHQREK